MVIVVLGQKLLGEHVHPQLRDRIEAGLSAYYSTNASYLVCSGGQTNINISSAESEVMKAYATERGICQDRILTEKQSCDTIGNAYFTRLLVEDLEYNPETIFLVTSKYHEERSEYIFEQCFGGESLVFS